MKDSTRNLENNQNTQLENKIYQLNKKIAKYEAIELKQNRFGLVWLDVPEAFDNDVENKLPILKEVPNLVWIIVGDGPKKKWFLEENSLQKCLTQTDLFQW